MKTDPEILKALKKDLKSVALNLTKQEARFLVDAYYQMQENRKRGYNQERSAGLNGDPSRILTYLATQAEDLENLARKALDYWSAGHPMGIWLRNIRGIGEVMAAGFLAHLDIEECNETYGHLYSFAGLNPKKEWKKGEKRPWNADLKTLCWKAGESFVKVSGYEDDFYGKLYQQRKVYEIQRNLSGALKDQAEAMLKKKADHAQRATYKKGILPDGHIHMRAKRWTVKLFLSHYWETYYRWYYDKEPPVPFAITKGHAHYIKPPFPPPAPRQPKTMREPASASKPSSQREPDPESEPSRLSEPPSKCEPEIGSEPSIPSEPGSSSEPKRPCEPR